jgi:hypothetical protein
VPVLPCSPSPLRRFHQQEHRNVFVEYCRAHGAPGSGSALPHATPGASRRRERRACGCGEAGPASHVSHEQEVRRPRSGSAVVPRSLIRNPKAPPSFAYATMGGCRISRDLAGDPPRAFLCPKSARHACGRWRKRGLGRRSRADRALKYLESSKVRTMIRGSASTSCRVRSKSRRAKPWKTR